jgi:hypothetical protein
VWKVKKKKKKKKSGICVFGPVGLVAWGLIGVLGERKERDLGKSKAMGGRSSGGVGLKKEEMRLRSDGRRAIAHWLSGVQAPNPI